MDSRREHQPQRGDPILPTQHFRNRKQTRKGCQVSRIQILVEDVERRSRNRQREQGSHQSDGGPMRALVLEERLRQAQGCGQKQNDRSDLPEQHHPAERKMAEACRCGNQVWIQRVPGVLRKEFCIHGEQAGVEDFQYARYIDFGVLGIGVIAMNQQCQRRDDQQADDPFHGRKHLVRAGSDDYNDWVRTPEHTCRRNPGSTRAQEPRDGLQPQPTLRSI